MARPLKQFTPDEARDWLHTLSSKISEADFSKNIKPKDENQDPRPLHRRMLDAWVDAQLELKPLQEKHVRYNKEPGEEAPADLQAWIDTYLSPEGWARLRSAKRQAKSTQNKKRSWDKRETLTKITPNANDDFAILAKRAGVTKKDYMCALADWLINTKAGQYTAVEFASIAKKLQEKKV